MCCFIFLELFCYDKAVVGESDWDIVKLVKYEHGLSFGYCVLSALLYVGIECKYWLILCFSCTIFLVWINNIKNKVSNGILLAGRATLLFSLPLPVNILYTKALFGLNSRRVLIGKENKTVKWIKFFLKLKYTKFLQKLSHLTSPKANVHKLILTCWRSLVNFTSLLLSPKSVYGEVYLDTALIMF